MSYQEVRLFGIFATGSYQYCFRKIKHVLSRKHKTRHPFTLVKFMRTNLQNYLVLDFETLSDFLSTILNKENL